MERGSVIDAIEEYLNYAKVEIYTVVINGKNLLVRFTCRYSSATPSSRP